MGYEPSLTHVCMWLNKSWKAISAAEAYALTGGTGVSSEQRMFICNLCGQFVTLTSGNKQQPHFRHSSANSDKSCEQRTFASGDGSGYDPREHLLPIRMVKSKFSKSFRFELGLIRAPIEDLSDDFELLIKPCDLTYSKARFNTHSITYVDVGSLPYPRYVLSFTNGTEELYEYWPSLIPGINPHGTLFNKDTGRKLIQDADVLINKDYLLLIYGSLPIGNNQSLSITKIEHEQAGWDGWSLYEVRATNYDDETAKFFINFHCRLTEKPASIQPIWPLYSEGSFIIRHNHDKLNLLVGGNVSVIKTFPRSKIEELGKSNSDATLYELKCSDRQQLISTGRAKVLQYTYFWREPLARTGVAPSVRVTDLEGNEISEGAHYDLSAMSLMVHSPFDGYVLIKDFAYIVDRVPLKGGTATRIDSLFPNCKVEVFVGHDSLWHAYGFTASPSAVTASEPSATTSAADVDDVEDTATAATDAAASVESSEHGNTDSSQHESQSDAQAAEDGDAATHDVDDEDNGAEISLDDEADSVEADDSGGADDGGGESFDALDLMAQLSRLSGSTIKAPHSMRNLQAAFRAYPQLSAWIRQRIQQGTINERAYRLLQRAYSQVKTGQ